MVEARVRGAHNKWVRDEGCLLRRWHAYTHLYAALVAWGMVAIADRRAISVGQELPLLASDKRIREDDQLIDPTA